MTDRLEEMRKRAQFHNLESPKTTGERDAMLLAVDCLWLIAEVERLRKELSEDEGTVSKFNDSLAKAVLDVKRLREALIEERARRNLTPHPFAELTPKGKEIQLDEARTELKKEHPEWFS